MFTKYFQKRSNRLALLLLVFISLLIIPAIPSLLLINIPQSKQLDLKYPEKLYGEKIIGFEINSNENINAVGVSIKNANLQNKNNIYLRAYNENGSLLGESMVSGYSVGDGDFVKFKFPKAMENNGNTKLEFSSPTSMGSNAFEIYMTNENTPSYQIFTNSNKLDLSYKQIKLFINHFMADKLFVMYYLVILICLSTIILL